MNTMLLQRWFDEHFPYFRVACEGEGLCRLRYNGETIPAEHWSLFTQFTAALGFPLDFSSSLYVGVTVPCTRLMHLIEAHFPGASSQG